MTERTLPQHIQDWTREDVHYWLLQKVNVYKKYADSLLEEEVSGLELLSFKKQDLLELAIKHGPAVRIIDMRDKLIKQQMLQPGSEIKNYHKEECFAGPQTSHVNDEKAISKSVNASGHKETQIKHEDPLKEQVVCSPMKLVGGNSSDMQERGTEEEMASVVPVVEKNETYAREPVHVEQVHDETSQNLCDFCPFDSDASHRYIQHHFLSPETGPGNLIKPVHEFKYMGRSNDINVLKRKFNQEVFRFAAGCMNSRTNGTIHMGIADSKATDFRHGEIIGVNIKQCDTIIDHFNIGMNSYFEENSGDARECIRQPKFVEVLYSNMTSSDLYVIEVDIVPSHHITCGKTYYIQTLESNNNWKKSKDKSLFVREGAATKDICSPNSEVFRRGLETFKRNMKSLDSKREEMEKRPESKIKTNQGEMLQNLLTCGEKTLDHYDYYVIVTNKTYQEQLQHLQFFNMLKIFCVLDFDPESASNGLCSEYRKSRVANLYAPEQFHGDAGTVIKTLNLYKQTSWVFCNGRLDLDIESNKPLNPKEWLVKRANDVNEVIRFICNPDILQRKRSLVVFLLFSTAEAMNDPIFETFMSFYKNLGGAQNIIHICASECDFQKWKDFIQTRCEIDVTRQSIYALEMSEINGSIIKLGQHKHPSGRLLPSSNESSVILHQKDEDQMTALDVLCENECENVYDEDSDEFSEFKKITEAEFYRGDKVKWWNFYFSEKPTAKPFIKRDKFDQLKRLVRSQTNNPTSTCVMLHLFHHPGCGGTTLAMHVMWSLRKEFRCAVLKDNTALKEEVAQQVAHLLKCGKNENSFQTPVLLLVEDSVETENTQELQRCVRKMVDEVSSSALVVILSCLRSKNPKDMYKDSMTESLYLTAHLSKPEQDAFEAKLHELNETHEKPGNFYSFMIMKSNFNQDYVTKLVSNTLNGFDPEDKHAQLLSFLALLNSYVAESNISESLCDMFLNKEISFWGKLSVLDGMEPYSSLLIQTKVSEPGNYTAVRVLHVRIATACLDELEKRYNSPRSDITLNLLHCDLFFKRGMGKDAFMQSVKSMLITRQRKTEGEERDTLFSPLIEYIKDEERQECGMKKIQDIFTIASERFHKDYTVPQALARHFYLNEKDFSLALTWANTARDIKKNSYTMDTIGQVHKIDLKLKIENQKSKRLSSQALEEYLELASKAIDAFQTAQELAKNDDCRFMDETIETQEIVDHHKKRNIYNTSGYMGELETAMTVYDVIYKLPLFKDDDPMKHMYLQNFLEGKMAIQNISFDHTEANDTLASVLHDHEQFLTHLKIQVKNVFTFFEKYFTYTKERTVDQGNEIMLRQRISEYFKKYISNFCTTPEERSKEQKGRPVLSLNAKIEECRRFLEEKKAESFPGLLQYLEDKTGKIEQVVENYSFLCEKSEKKDKVRDKINYLLATVILTLTQPNSKFAQKQHELTVRMNEILQEVGTQYPHPEPYYLAMLLLWPETKTTTNSNFSIYVNSLRNSSRKQLSFLFRRRNTIPHFFLGKSKGLERLLPKATLDQCFDSVRERNALWQRADVFRNKEIQDRLLRVDGIIQQGMVYTQYGTLQIPVRPTYLGGMSAYSTEKVTFYLGFAIDGPLAYDIQYTDDLL